MSHWYSQEGQPVYEVERSDGKGKRDTTLRDAKKLNLMPSVTTIIQSIATPGLEVWKIQQVLNAALKYRNLNKEDEQWKAIVLNESKQIGKVAADKGNEIHNQLEEVFISGKIENKKFIQPIIELLQNKFILKKTIPEKSFAHTLGFGGKVDLIIESGFSIIIDFKTKNKDKVGIECVTDEHCMQLAAYRYGLDFNYTSCYNLYISTKNPGEIYLHQWSEAELERGWKMFKCLLEFWKLRNHML